METIVLCIFKGNCIHPSRSFHSFPKKHNFAAIRLFVAEATVVVRILAPVERCHKKLVMGESSRVATVTEPLRVGRAICAGSVPRGEWQSNEFWRGMGGRVDGRPRSGVSHCLIAVG